MDPTPVGKFLKQERWIMPCTIPAFRGNMRVAGARWMLPRGTESSLRNCFCDSVLTRALSRFSAAEHSMLRIVGRQSTNLRRVTVTATTSAIEQQPKHRHLQFSLRSLLAFVLLVSMGLGAGAAYFNEAKLDGKVLFGACACGLTHATITDGEVVLAEANHDTPAGATVAIVEIKDRICTLRRMDADGVVGTAKRFQIDHLGAYYYVPESFGNQRVYVLMADNWKLYPVRFLRWLNALIN